MGYVVQVVLLQNVFYRALNPIWRRVWQGRLPTIQSEDNKSQLPPNYKFLYSSLRSVDPSEVSVQIENSLTSYVFLVDNKTAKIRLVSSGLANDVDITTLVQTIQRLQELRKP
jgi:hypothetical protein